MAQTDQVWEWGVEQRDEGRSELELVHQAVGHFRAQLDRAHEALKSSRQRHQDSSEALGQVAEARPWRRRDVRTALQERQRL